MPPHKCSYFRCENTSERKSMFRFPWQDTSRLKLWLNYCGNMTITHLTPVGLRSRYLCIDHFNEKYIRNKTGLRTRLTRTAIPEPYQTQCSDHSRSSSADSENLKVLLPKKVYQNKRTLPNIIEDPKGIQEECYRSTPKRRKRCNKKFSLKRKLDNKTTLVAEIDLSLKREVDNEATLVAEIDGRAIISRVYHYLDKEYEQLKSLTNNSYDLSLLANTLKRTATATGVSEQLITEILEQELSEDDICEAAPEKCVKVDNEDQPEAGRCDPLRSPSHEGSSDTTHDEVKMEIEEHPLELAEDLIESPCDPLRSPSHEGSSDTTHDEVKMEIEEHPLELAEDLIESPSVPPGQHEPSVTTHDAVKSEPADDNTHPHQLQFGTQMPRPKQQTKEERLEKRRFYARRRKERMKSNEVAYEEFLRKDRERYARKKAAGLIVSRHQMTLSQLRILRRKNKISAAACYHRKRNRAAAAPIVARAYIDETIGDLVEDEPDQSLPNQSDEDNNNSG